ncbi:uncharacterized protein LAESUDRAFT_649329 [Laetiporus sulphureus 93-53]|uniref:Helitron helicase-like domain-containing protein n=1 Tax=Laetiporus sulphureus 93-53 TaxID=1314785 RepID=A0A165F5F9_9APHY|nr:uncharacterized protein LAESUDRAFT_649329 [Laetiporus sulphureus 93-53]KZT08427.1 hypothetical protein LAESUDRAFT_649329 [Laetiporus sulphureus 93-53]
MQILRHITVDNLRQAAREEAAKMSISNRAMRLLKKHIHAVGGWVMESDQACYQLRSKIWSTSIYLSPRTLWMTINPDDLHDPNLLGSALT